ncbi:MAG TPA: tRNA 2-thiouridine(34) synthase MnmA [Deltaproteobacteria bacterium]|nr:tRNA 2-thiouridine(34) synthase MnmA [Deltaproteobacteria bacterium]
MTIQELKSKKQQRPHPHPNPPLEGEGIHFACTAEKCNIAHPNPPLEGEGAESKKIAVAMSGGVDSSVTAALLQQQGHEVIGITMRLFLSDKTGPGTPVHDAAQVAAQLGIEHHVVDFSPQFGELIIDDFIQEYRCGHTPNPCVQCNRFIKFGLLLEAARQLGADTLATGHYVRKTWDSDGTCHLRTARNIRKDQSYFLYTLTQERLKRVIFPLGEMESKDDVRRLARELGITAADKVDSQEVCFIPNDDYVAFLEQGHRIKATAGDIIHVSGKLLGRHKGTHRYTIGQRKGLGIAWKRPLFVVAIDVQRNAVIVGEETEIYAGGLLAEQVSWIIGPDANEFATTCKIRYRHQPVSCRVELLGENRCRVTFDEPQKSVTPGQSVVFYQDDEVLGGGRITGADKTDN